MPDPFLAPARVIECLRANIFPFHDHYFAPLVNRCHERRCNGICSRYIRESYAAPLELWPLLLACLHAPWCRTPSSNRGEARVSHLVVRLGNILRRTE